MRSGADLREAVQVRTKLLAACSLLHVRALSHGQLLMLSSRR